MNQKSREKEKNGLEALPSDEKRGKREPASRLQPHWPIGLRLPSSEDVTCFIPEGLAVILSREAFEQVFGYAYSTR